MPKVTVSRGTAAKVNGLPTPYLYGSGYGRDADLQKLGHQAANLLVERYGRDVEIRGNSDGHSCGAHHNGEFPFSLGAWREHDTQLNHDTFEREPNPDAGKITFDAHFSVPLGREAEVRAAFPDCWVYPDARARELNPSSHVTVYSQHFDTMEEAWEWLKGNGEKYSPVLRIRKGGRP